MLEIEPGEREVSKVYKFAPGGEERRRDLKWLLCAILAVLFNS